MTISAFHSGVNMLHQAQNMATTGAKEIQQSTLSPSRPAEQSTTTTLSSSVPVSGVSSPDEVISKASTDLLQAKSYNQAGANVIRRADEMTGSLLNIKV
ncbi:hypothetical protein [uncultured Photobacterium sp.]|uniref:hypothetical protein n=1 Tax=uncultured Photobacterium sp. TaxID=173973 RepID=UPI002639DAC1|nr:hypothetical protein [uncultured Photobacterium sp.]